MSKHRILTLAHGHPDFHKGGGEIAAYGLHTAYAQNPNVEAAWFLARADRGRGPSGRIVRRRENEFLWEQNVRDTHAMRTTNQFELHGYFTELLQALRPTIVHLHHYLYFGLEVLAIIKRVDPSIRIVMTLHEFFAICMNEGQMIKAGSQTLCHASGLDDCHRCFPQFSPEDFWLRRHRFDHYFALVDQFVTPSDFLRNRYIDWGIAPDRIVTIENGQPDRAPLPPRPLAVGETRNRFGFFGQINRFKGVDVLLEALIGLPRKQRRRLMLEVHGANLEHQPEAFRHRIKAMRAELEADRVLHWVGPYESHQMPARLAAIDWVMVPSIWWENSPMVIQEAFAYGRPVIASDIGGMAEKVTNGGDGRHVSMGNPFAWAQTMLELAADPTEWDRLQAGIRRPLSHADCATAHLTRL